MSNRARSFLGVVLLRVVSTLAVTGFFAGPFVVGAHLAATQRERIATNDAALAATRAVVARLPSAAALGTERARLTTDIDAIAALGRARARTVNALCAIDSAARHAGVDVTRVDENGGGAAIDVGSVDNVDFSEFMRELQRDQFVDVTACSWMPHCSDIATRQEPDENVYYDRVWLKVPTYFTFDSARCTSGYRP